MRSAQEHRDMCWGDVKLKVDDDGLEYLKYSGRQTKTRTGENPKDIRSVPQKMWVNLDDPSGCPFNVYKLYSAKRPGFIVNQTHLFTLLQPPKPPDQLHEFDQWFKRQPVGDGKITKMVKSMVAGSNIQTERKLSNRSARKHLVQKMKKSGVAAEDIVQITGHKNIQSVNNYSELSTGQHKQISKILSTNQPIVRKPSATVGSATGPSTLNSMSAMVPVPNAAGAAASIPNMSNAVHSNSVLHIYGESKP